MKKIFTLMVASLLLVSSLFESEAVYAKTFAKESVTYFTYKVKKGDTLYQIAKNYKSTTDDLKMLNKLKTTTLKINQLLKIPVKKETAKLPSIGTLQNITGSNKDSYIINGTAEPKATVNLIFTDSLKHKISQNVVADLKGKFVKKVSVSELKDGNLTLNYSQKTIKGIVSAIGQKTLVKDTVGPSVQLNINNITADNESNYQINGKAEKNSNVIISMDDGVHQSIVKTIKSNNMGNFSATFIVKTLNDGKITIKVKNKDLFGNEKNMTISVSKNTKKTETPVNPPAIDPSVYQLDAISLGKWDIYTDGSHPSETTKGLNDAIVWAHDNGYTTFKVPAGTYLVSKSSQINLVSNMTFDLDPKAIMQKETNALEGYQTLNIPINAHDVVIKGGTYIGDKLTHDYTNGAVLWQPNHAYKKGDKVVPPNTVGDNYTHYYVAQNDGISGSSEPAWLWTKQSTDNTVTWQPYAKSTNEGGYGIVLDGATNVTIDGIKAINYTGDGLAIGSKWTYFQDYYAASFETGAIDDQGNLTSSASTIRMKNPINLTDSRFSITHTFTFGHQQSIPGVYNIYFYKADGTFLSSLKNQYARQFIQIPDTATSMRVTFPTSNLTNDYVELWSWKASNNVIVKNSEFAFNRRQGITVGGGDNILITNNKLHDQKGTDPQSGIDLEGGDFVLNNDIDIKGNDFYNNQRYDVILYDGKNTTVEENHLGSKGAIGLAVSTPFIGATVKDNFFDGSSIYAYHDVSFIGNKMSGGLTHLEGPNISIDGMQFENGANFAVTPVSPYAIDIANVALNNSSFGINLNPVHVSNMTLNGGSFGGSVAGSTFDNLKVLNSAGTNLSPGTYNNCLFETIVTNNSPHTSLDGTYLFNNCAFKGAGPGFTGKNTDVTITNSIFDGAGFTIATAKNVDLENNIFTMNLTHNDLFKPSVIMIGGYWTRTSPYGVAKATIKNNTINSNDFAGGISTIFAGTGAPNYDIENNVLYNAKLFLNPNDINVNNKELTK